MGKGEGSGGGGGMGSGQYKGKFERVFFPAMPLPMAIICCVLNFLIPGLGSAVAGLTVFCCARNEDMDAAPRALSCFTSCGIGFLQLVTTILLLLGWFWSCFWGVTFIMMSLEYYHNNKVDDYDRGTATEHQVPATQLVYEAGSSTPTAVIVQPTHIPYKVAQPASNKHQESVTMQPLSVTALDSTQPLEPPPAYTEVEKQPM